MALSGRILYNILEEDENEKLRRIKIAMARKRRMREDEEDERMDKLNRMFPM